MLEVSKKYFPLSHAAIMSAAVSDYKPEQAHELKIKRSGEHLALNLVPNPDIAREMGQLKMPGQILAGFALETNNEEANALKKLKTKNLDFIVLNSLAVKGAGFMADTNQISIIDSENKIQHYPLKSKTEVARDIVTFLEVLLSKGETVTV
jgi:phosphopantothenoylcysteine decarboxylase/phosphopantothenate--cysteine ligase